MKKGMDLSPSMWVAHDCKGVDLIPETLKTSLFEAQAAYIWDIWKEILPKDIVDNIARE